MFMLSVVGYGYGLESPNLPSMGAGGVQKVQGVQLKNMTQLVYATMF